MGGLFRNTFFVTLSQGWHMIMALVMMPFASRYLGVEGFGQYNTATVIMFYVFLINDFGLNTWITREVARDKLQTQSILSHAIGLKIMLILPCLIFVWLYYLLTDYDTKTYQAIWIFTVYGIIDSFTQLAYAIFRSWQRMELETLVAAIAKTTLTGLGIMALVLGWGLQAFSAMFVVSTLLGLLVAFSLIRKKFVPIAVHFNFRQFFRMLTFSANFGLALFVASSYDKIDVLMLSWLKGMETVGLYSAPNKLLSFTNLIPTIFATAFFPQMAYYVKDHKELSRIFSLGVKYLFMLAIPFVTGVFLLSKQLTILVFGNLFSESAVALRIMAFAAGLNFLNLFLTSVYGATNHQKKILQIEVIALVFKIAVNVVLIPKYSYIGAGISALATEALVFILAMSWALRKITTLNEWSFIYKFIFATFIMGFVLYLMQNQPLLLCVAIAIVVYFAMLLMNGALDIEQIKYNLKRRTIG